MRRVLSAWLAAGSLCIVFAREQPSPEWASQGVIALNHSLNARMHPLPVSALKIPDGFWAVRRKPGAERILPGLLDLMEEHGLLDNFRRAAGKKNVPRKGRATSDADVYQWIEAAAWFIASPDASNTPEKQRIQARLEPVITDVLAAQDATGYLDTFYSAEKTHLRLTDPAHSGEDYCLQHLIQAAIADYRATGERRLLDASIRFSDNILATFGPTKRPLVTGYPGLEMALIELYRTTGETKYLDFSRYLLSGVERDRLRLKDSEIHYMFSGKPFTSHTEFEGHVIRALNAASGATDFLAESGDPAYRHALDLLWNDLTLRKMSITGGVATQSSGEFFGAPYDIPSSSNSEPCSAVASVMWSFRMLALTGEARYADVLEQSLYNGALVGSNAAASLSCYRTFLSAVAERLKGANPDADCCPLSVETLLESLPGYFYGTSRDGLYVNLYNSSELNWHLEDGARLRITQTTDYPWDGEVKLTLYPAKPVPFTLHLRWPSWAASAEVTVNGTRTSVESARGEYIPITRTWQPGDSVQVEFPMQTVPMRANSRVTTLNGRIAIVRGPLVYGTEQNEQGAAAHSDISIRSNGTGTAEFHKEIMGGTTVVKYPGFIAERPPADQPLYENAAVASAKSRRAMTLTLMPYSSSANRETGQTEVWIPSVRVPENQSAGVTNRGVENRQITQ